MKVTLRPEAAGRDNVRGWLRLEYEYVVLSIESIAGDTMAYRIVSEDNHTPALFEISLFDVVDNRIPPSWIVVPVEGTMLHFMPAGWAESGFWEALFDGDPAATEAFGEQVRELQTDSNHAE
jgi:hypothetical protein